MNQLPTFSSPLSALSFLLSALIFLLSASTILAQIPDPLAPPNTAKIYGNLYISKTEAANIEWMEFLTAVRQDSGLAYYQRMLPDSTLVNIEVDSYFLPRYYNPQNGIFVVATAPATISYMRSPSAKDYPVIGITHQQANAYCAWRSRVFTKKYASDQGTGALLGKRKVEFKFRLPTEEEWMFAAAADLDTAAYHYGFKEFQTRSSLWNDPTGYWQKVSKTSSLSFSEFEFIFKQFQKHGREPFFNCLKDFYTYFHYGANQPISTLPPKKKKPNQINGFGLYAMIGNVSEMIDMPGIAKGGSWAQPVEECRISSRQYYSKPEGWLGFRCVCEVIITD